MDEDLNLDTQKLHFDEQLNVYYPKPGENIQFSNNNCRWVSNTDPSNLGEEKIKAPISAAQVEAIKSSKLVISADYDFSKLTFLQAEYILKEIVWETGMSERENWSVFEFPVSTGLDTKTP